MSGILLVGTEKDRALALRGLLREDGHHVVWHRRADDWRSREREMTPDLVVAPIECAEEVLAAAGRAPRGFPAPLLLIEGDRAFGRDPFLADRLVDRLSGPFTREELLARADALIRARRTILRRDLDGDGPSQGLRARVGAWLGARFPQREKPLSPYLEVAARIAEWGDRRDAFRPGHQERVATLCGMIAEGLDMGDDETAALLRAAMLHDIGKVALPVEVLHQAGPLDELQMRLVRTHPQRGAALLRALDPDDGVARTVLYHHECPDGSGYYGKAADHTPRTARALAVAEVFDAMTNCRGTRRLPGPEALRSLQALQGETLDTDCVEALVDHLRPRPEGHSLASRA